MSTQNDENQKIAFMLLAGIVTAVIAGVIGLAVSRSGPKNAPAAGKAAVEAPAPAAPAAPTEPVAAPVVVSEAAERLYFEVGSDALPADAVGVLAKVADAARANGGVSVLISGFHDASGDPQKNADLAKRRALAVRHALEANGVAPERLVMSKPEMTTGGTDPREARRVELRLR